MGILTQKEKELLSVIVNDKYAVGPFTGMITNLCINNKIDTEYTIKEALIIRLKLVEMSK